MKIKYFAKKLERQQQIVDDEGNAILDKNGDNQFETISILDMSDVVIDIKSRDQHGVVWLLGIDKTDREEVKRPNDWPHEYTSKIEHFSIDGVNQGIEIWRDETGEALWLPDNAVPKTIEEIQFENRPDLASYKTAKKLNVVARVDDIVKGLLWEFTQSEQSDWPAMGLEAKAYDSDSNASTPYIEKWANIRGITKEDMLLKVIALEPQTSVIPAIASKVRAAFHSMIDAATTHEEVDAAILQMEALEAQFAQIANGGIENFDPSQVLALLEG